MEPLTDLLGANKKLGLPQRSTTERLAAEMALRTYLMGYGTKQDIFAERH